MKWLRRAAPRLLYLYCHARRGTADFGISLKKWWSHQRWNYHEDVVSGIAVLDGSRCTGATSCTQTCVYKNDFLSSGPQTETHAPKRHLAACWFGRVWCVALSLCAWFYATSFPTVTSSCHLHHMCDMFCDCGSIWTVFNVWLFEACTHKCVNETKDVETQFDIHLFHNAF